MNTAIKNVSVQVCCFSAMIEKERVLLLEVSVLDIHSKPTASLLELQVVCIEESLLCG